ncbi:NifB/NifX family molybdenum-iron cluster-binding protein [Motiliproteus sediminis]|uniref:NifB/NifX family molybdenum-iron cluster-binding protein n=1 Tax=Motiliproteus sediminis TaxID=1468178 RepID=UPI001AF0213D|nr:NifB/NifX family molybdenum-iron cluster-binding protein [Motiliproteus sediminis]
MSDSDFRFRIAIASNDGKTIDGHFGSCEQFLIYEFDADTVVPLEQRPASTEGGIDKNDYRAAQLADCHLLYVASIGGPAAAKVIKTGVHPLRDPNSTAISEALIKLQQVLKGTPPPWMAKMMGAANPLATKLEAAND